MWYRDPGEQLRSSAFLLERPIIAELRKSGQPCASEL